MLYVLKPYVLFLHVLAAAVLLGNSLAFVVARGTLRRARSVEAIMSWLHFGRRLGRANPVAALLLLGTGVYLGSFGWWRSAWFSAALAGFVVNTLLARTLPAFAQRVGIAAHTNNAAALERARWSWRWETLCDVMLANDLALLFVMIAKPAWVGTLAAFAAAHLALTLLRQIRRLQATRMSPAVLEGERGAF